METVSIRGCTTKPYLIKNISQRNGETKMSKTNSKETNQPLKRTGKKPKEKPLSMSQLINKIKGLPLGSLEYIETHEKLKLKMESKYPNQYVLCVPNKYVVHDKTDEDMLVNLDDYTSFDHRIFHNKRSFAEDIARFSFESRGDCEYNLMFKQVNVMAYITDGTKYIVLCKKTNKELGFVGGHVDYTFEACQLSQMEFLRLSLQREIDEEINHGNLLRAPMEYQCILNTNEKVNDTFHIGVLYRINVENIDEVMENIETGEPEKHDVVKFDSKKELMAYSKKHNWFDTISKHI